MKTLVVVTLVLVAACQHPPPSPPASPAQACEEKTYEYEIGEARLRLAPYEPTVPSELTDPAGPWVMQVYEKCAPRRTWVHLDRPGGHNWGGYWFDFSDGKEIVAKKSTWGDLTELFHAVGASALTWRQGGHVMYARVGPDVHGTRTLELGFSFEESFDGTSGGAFLRLRAEARP